ncbi:MAG TPA: zf-HC2 domain-containing protein [Sedimentisphaerales bacterium]|nr:zf-HC2 domain-containing protein [Sedimentisphaerales bacterium]
MEKTCRHIQELMPDLLAQTLSVEKAAELRRHITQCAACERYLLALHGDDRLLTKFTETMQPTIVRLEDQVTELLNRRLSGKVVSPGSLWATITKRPIRKLAAAAVIITAVLIGIRQFSGWITVESVAFGDMKKAVDKMPFIHKILDTNTDGKKHHTEMWHCFESRTTLSKYAVDGKCYKISSLNYDTMENVVYDPNADVIKVVYRVDVSADSLPTSPWSLVEDYIKDFEREEGIIKHEKDQREGQDVDVYYLTIPSDFRKEKVEAELTVDQKTHLPIIYKRKFWTPKGYLRFDQIISFDFTESAPQDIYDLGVPRSTRVVYDAASKQMFDEKKKLLQDKAVYEQRLNQVYRLDEGQVLRHIPPSLIEPRRKIDCINRRIRQIEYAGSQILTCKASCRTKQNTNDEYYTMFRWDGKLMIVDSRPIFSGPVSLKTAFERIIGLSSFQYDIPDNLLAIEIPGDWVVRKGASKEQKLRTFEKVVQDYTKRPIRFEKQPLERDVIVARGKFQFKPMHGTHDDSWIHVFSDKLDPDERGGGTSGSTLDRFLNQRLAAQLNQQVVNLAQPSEDEVHTYGTHMSAYLCKMPDGPERDAKLKLLLENLARQTSLVFTEERRTVDVWHVIAED